MVQETPRQRVAAVSDPPPDLVGTDFEGRYRIESRLGAGGVGVVYRATDLKLSRPVALKVLHERANAMRSTRKRFEREARALAALSHPHVVGIIDFGIADATTYLVMELLEGFTLNELLRRRVHLEQEQAFRILRQILLGLASVHRHGLVHRDLKPGNVFLQPLGDGTEHVKLLDFGLAKFLDPESAENGAPITRFGEVFGTPGYLAPEQLSGAPIDVRADIYAVGVVLFEMLAGRKPFVGESHELLRRQLVDPLPSIHDVCPSRRAVPQLEDMLKRMLARDPSGRFRSVDELSAAFEALPGLAVVESDGASSSGEHLAEASSVLDADSEAKTRLHQRASQRPLLSVPNVVQAMGEWIRGPEIVNRARTIGGRIARAKGVKALRAVWERPRYPMVAGAIVFVGLLTIAVLVVLTARSVFETPEGDERQQRDERVTAVRSRLEPAMRESASDRARVRRSSTGQTPTSGVTKSRGVGESNSGEAENQRAPTVGKPTVIEGGGKSEISATDKRPPAVDPWTGAVPKNLAQVRLSVMDGRKLGKRTEEFLRQYNQARPEDPRGHILLAAMFLNRNWVSDAISHYELAFRIDPGCRGDPAMLHGLLQIVAEKSVGERASGLVRKIYGSEALPELDRAIEKHKRDQRAVKRLGRLRATLVSK